MKREDFRKLVYEVPILLDGASGTWLQSRGLPVGACPETWGEAHPELLKELHRDYFLAGAGIVVTFTLGGTAPKLAHYHIPEDQVAGINESLARIAVEARDEALVKLKGTPDENRKLLVSGNIGPTGQFLAPAGDQTTRQLIDTFRQQVRGLLAGGVDLFSIETMMDLGQILAAIRAVRQECDLPVIATLTFDENGRTLSGNPPSAGAVAMEAAGADAIGANCSTGPVRMGAVLDGLAQMTGLPVVIKPNAGMPHVENGQTVFDMSAEAFVDAMVPLLSKGIGRIIGGCCGTSHGYIAALDLAMKSIDVPRPNPIDPTVATLIASARQIAQAPDADSIPYVKVSDADALQDDVMDAMEDEPVILGLDFTNVQETDIAALCEELTWVQSMCTVPLVFRCDDPVLLAALTEVYIGRAGVVTQAEGAFHGAFRIGD